MKYYAQVNENNICIGVSALNGAVTSSNMIELDGYDENFLGKKFENNTWSEERFLPDFAQIEISRMEKLERSQEDQDDLLTDILFGRV